MWWSRHRMYLLLILSLLTSRTMSSSSHNRIFHIFLCLVQGRPGALWVPCGILSWDSPPLQWIKLELLCLYGSFFSLLCKRGLFITLETWPSPSKLPPPLLIIWSLCEYAGTLNMNHQIPSWWGFLMYVDRLQHIYDEFTNKYGFLWSVHCNIPSAKSWGWSLSDLC